MSEIWKPVVGYEGIYEVSSFGRVKTLPKKTLYKGGPTYAQRKEKILSLSTDKDGYKIVGLRANGKSKMFKVHRLVATAFIPNQDKLRQINHKDNNRSNNNVDNLEWCTCQQNIQHKFRMGYSQKDKRPGRTVIGEDGTVYQSIISAARALGLTAEAIYYRASSPNFKTTII